LNNVFTDVEDGTALAFTVESNSNPTLIPTVTIDADSALDLTVAANENGTATITVRATDSGGLWVEDVFDVVVTGDNDQPVVASAIPDTTVAENSGDILDYRDLNNVFTDVEDGTALAFTVESNSNPTLIPNVVIDADSALDLTVAANETGTATITVRATDSGGLWVEDVFDVVVTTADSWTVITYDDFESGMGNYTDGGDDMELYTSGAYAHQGTNAAGIQDNSGTASSFYHTAGYDVTGYSELEVEFWFYAVSMDNATEDFWVQYYDGSTWQTVATYVKTTDFENKVFYNEVVTISSGQYNFPADAKIRFMCDANGDRDDVYIDEIEFRGFSTGGAATSPITLGSQSLTPNRFSLSQNYPNPFNPVTTISFSLPEASYVRLDVFDVAGRRVATLVDETRNAGVHNVTFDASSMASGVYFYRIEAGDMTETKKMILVK
jgi:hypothetical protein